MGTTDETESTSSENTNELIVMPKKVGMNFENKCAARFMPGPLSSIFKDVKFPTKTDIEAAHERIRPFVHRTPVLTCKTLDDVSQMTILLKCENFQHTGAFKVRGATNAVLNLSEEEAAKGVVAYSSGNHAQAVSLAARNRGIPAHIVVYNNNKIKTDAARKYGGNIIQCEPLPTTARLEAVQKIKEETGATFISPCDHFDVMSGAATACVELLE